MTTEIDRLIERLREEVQFATGAHQIDGELIEEAADQLELLKPMLAERERLIEALTPSGATKFAYIGEFSFLIDEQGEAMCEVTRKLDVPWTTIKEIMAAIKARVTQTGEQQ